MAQTAKPLGVSCWVLPLFSLRIDEIKGGFNAFGSSIDLTEQMGEAYGQLAFVAIGLALTAVLQSVMPL